MTTRSNKQTLARQLQAQEGIPYQTAFKRVERALRMGLLPQPLKDHMAAALYILKDLPEELSSASKLVTRSLMLPGAGSGTGFWLTKKPTAMVELPFEELKSGTVLVGSTGSGAVLVATEIALQLSNAGLSITIVGTDSRDSSQEGILKKIPSLKRLTVRDVEEWDGTGNRYYAADPLGESQKTSIMLARLVEQLTSIPNPLSRLVILEYAYHYHTEFLMKLLDGAHTAGLLVILHAQSVDDLPKEVWQRTGAVLALRTSQLRAAEALAHKVGNGYTPEYFQYLDMGTGVVKTATKTAEFGRQWL